MKTYAKLFEDFIKEEDPLAALDVGDEKKDKKKEEDPIKKLQRIEKEKEDKKEDNLDNFVEDKIKELENEFKKHPELEKEIGKETIDAVKSKDRIRIHNAVNDLIYLQVKYEKAGEVDKIAQITPIKELVDDLDRSGTNSKMM